MFIVREFSSTVTMTRDDNRHVASGTIESRQPPQKDSNRC